MIEPRAVHQASAELTGVIVRTPLLRSFTLDAAVGARVACKAEGFQHTNSFKFRGAYHHVASLSAGERARGVIAASSGNHAHAVALAAQLLDSSATVVIPDDASPIKVAAARGLGANIVNYDRHSDDRDAIVARIAAWHGHPIVPSADSPRVIAGAGTVALEILDDDPAIDALVVPIGGGGLAAGCATIVKAIAPRARVIGVEPTLADDTARSLRAGRPVTVAPPDTIAEGLRHRSPSPLPFSILQRLIDDIVCVDDDAILTALTHCHEHLRLVVEPSGACALAALLVGAIAPRPRRPAVVLSGANIDWPALRAVIDQRAA